MIKTDSEFEALIAPLTPSEYKVLEESIMNDGCRDAIVTWNDTIIDGHHRYKICQANGIEFNTHPMEFPSKTEAKIWMILNQVGRRNLTPSQRAILYSITLESLEAEKAKERQLATLKKGTELPRQDNIILSGNDQKGQARDFAAKSLGISPAMVSDAKAVYASAPELVPKIASGELPVHTAAQIAREPDQEKKEDRIKSLLSAEGKAEVQEKSRWIRQQLEEEREQRKIHSDAAMIRLLAERKGIEPEPINPVIELRKIAESKQVIEELEVYQEKKNILRQAINVILDTLASKGYVIVAENGRKTLDTGLISAVFLEVIEERRKNPHWMVDIDVCNKGDD